MVLAAITLLTLIAGSRASELSYDPDDHYGPSNWKEINAQCGGDYQSPINIETSKALKVLMPPFKFQGFNQRPLAASLTNNGHSAQVVLTTAEPITVSGGPLKGDYTFEQFHFHWGKNNSAGSENTVDQKSFSMEQHLVFYKTEYGSIAEALRHRDGVAVLAVFYKETFWGNSAMNRIVGGLPLVEEPETTVDLNFMPPLSDFLPKDRTRYFTHQGSLTTPPCAESVTWIEFLRTLTISRNQLEQFRRIKGGNGELLHNNVRPTQPLNGRSVYFSVSILEYFLQTIFK